MSDNRVKWQDGAVERRGWVLMDSTPGKVYVQDEAGYAYRVDEADLSPAPFTPEERAALKAAIGEWGADYTL